MKVDVDVVILGAGPAGLGAAAKLVEKGLSVHLIDRAQTVGGAAASFRVKDCIVDYGPHAFHLKKKEIIDFVRELAGDDAVEVTRKSQLILDNKLLKYPLDVQEAFFKISPLLSARILFDYSLSNLKRVLGVGRPDIETFESWGQAAFGNTLYRLAFGNYSERMWGVPGNQLSASLARQKLLKLNLWKIISNLVGFSDPTFEGGVTAPYDLYPRYGIGTIFDRLANRITSSRGSGVNLAAEVQRIDLGDDNAVSVTFNTNGSAHQVSASRLVSTIPLKFLSKYITGADAEKVARIGHSLRYRDVRIIYVLLNKPCHSDAHWIYLLDPHFRFNRLSEQKNLNRESCPDGKTVVSMDIACDAGDSVWTMPDNDFFAMAMKDLSLVNVSADDVEEYFSFRLADVYPVYDLGYEQRFEDMLCALELYPSIYSVGRQGLFLNNDIHDSLEMGFEVADHIAAGKVSREWYRFARNYISQRLEGRVK